MLHQVRISAILQRRNKKNRRTQQHYKCPFWDRCLMGTGRKHTPPVRSPLQVHGNYYLSFICSFEILIPGLAEVLIRPWITVIWWRCITGQPRLCDSASAGAVCGSRHRSFASRRHRQSVRVWHSSLYGPPPHRSLLRTPCNGPSRQYLQLNYSFSWNSPKATNPPRVLCRLSVPFVHSALTVRRIWKPFGRYTSGAHCVRWSFWNRKKRDLWDEPRSQNMQFKFLQANRNKAIQPNIKLL